MTHEISVMYHTGLLFPTPTVNYSHQPIDFGYVYGYNTEISLDGLYTGITSSGSAIQYLTGVFGQQFKALEVKATDENAITTTLYKWNNVVVDSITINSNPYFLGSFVKYNVRLRSYEFPSGVIEPSNEYIFAQEEDGTVTVNHKISARGVRNSSGAFENALAFVRQFTGKDPFTNCAPIFVPGGSGVLMGISETINRAEGSYAVSEVYRYNTGIFNAPYIKSTSLEISDSLDAEYKTIEYSLKIQGSPVVNNVSNILTSHLNNSVLAEINSDYGYNTGNWIKTTYSATTESGSATTDIKIGYVSGAASGGFLDYVVTSEIDYVAGVENWKVEGDFKTFGPLEYRKNQISSFKTASGANVFRNYLTGLIASSALYSSQHNTGKRFSPNLRVDISEEVKLAQLKLGGYLNDGYEPTGMTELKCNWEVSPSRWIYELLPSATIEGSYVIQDLQARTQTRQTMSLSYKSSKQNHSGVILLANGYLNTFANQYVKSGTPPTVTAFLVENSIVTGISEGSVTQTWLGEDSGLSTQIILQSAGSIAGAAPIRQSGYNFGY